jgi:hypothetical protein
MEWMQFNIFFFEEICYKSIKNRLSFKSIQQFKNAKKEILKMHFFKGS